MECRFEQTFVELLERIQKIHFLKKSFQKDICGPGRLTKIQTTSRPDHVWPEVWTKIGKAAQNREKQEWKKREAQTRQCSKE